jgi:hypothetical protein
MPVWPALELPLLTAVQFGITIRIEAGLDWTRQQLGATLRWFRSQRDPQDAGGTPFMSSHELTCPIWGDPPNPSEIGHFGQPYNSRRAGGRFTLEYSGAFELRPNYRPLTDKQRANLSYWIYQHNLDNRLFDESPEPGEAPPVLDKEWVERHRDCTPSPSDRMLAFLRELIRKDDAGKSASELLQEQDLHMAACGCRDYNDLAALYQHALKQEWVRAVTDQNGIPVMYFINHSARIHVEDQLREADNQLREQASREQVFVAMWFADCMEEVYDCGIKPAICAAGYQSQRIDRKRFLGSVTDEILAEIRQSRFVVADFTGCEECTACEKCKTIGVRGGVYFEAGYAHALNKNVIYTVRQDRKDTVHFDVNHLNRIEWKNPQDLRKQLQELIEEVLGRGPGTPPTNQVVG